MYDKELTLNLAHLRCELLVINMLHSIITFRTSKCWIHTFLASLGVKICINNNILYLSFVVT